MTTINQTEDLRTKVFEICENLYENNEKINRDIVREKLGGGSFSTISPLVAEWKEAKKVQLAEEESTEKSTASNIIKAESSDITDSLRGETITSEELNATSIKTEFIPDSDIENIVRAGAEKAAGVMIAQEAMATHFYQNPDQLPSDLKAQVEGMRGNFTQSRSTTNKAAYNPQNLINLAMKKIGQQQEDLKLIG